METKRIILARIGWVYLSMAVVALAILAQVLYLQLVRGDELRDDPNNVSQRQRPVPASRGDILAADGSPLASSLTTFDLAIDPSCIADTSFNKDIEALARGLSNLFPEKSARQYSQMIRNARSAGKEFLPLKRKISFDVAEQVRELPLFSLGKFKGGLILDPVTSREKPYQLLASRTIGNLNQGEEGNVVGLEGAWDHFLKGRDGLRFEYRIGGGTWVPVSLENEIEPMDGRDVVSTIDVKYQDVAQQALYDLLEYHQAHHGCAILMEVASGEVLAIANLGRGSDGKYYEDYNYAVGERTEPGSTFKLPAIMAALEDGYVDLDDTINTFRGSYPFYDRRVTDSHTGGFGMLTVREVIEKSSNIGMARLIDRYYRSNPQHFIDRLYAMGLNKPLGLEISGEPAPFIKSPADKDWWGTTLPWMAHGYEVLMTPLQVLTFYNAIANDGKMVRPRFTKELREHSQTWREIKTETIRNSICSRSTLEKAREMLAGVVTNGTASNLKPKYYTIAGKTGTAVVAQGDAGYRSEGGKKEYRASFVGYFPADKPRFSCIVVITRPNMGEYYGNKVAGSVFLAIADKVYATTTDLHAELVLAEGLDPEALPLLKPAPGAEMASLLDFMNLRMNPVPDPEQYYIYIPDHGRVQPEPLGKFDQALPDLTGLSLRDVLPELENRGMSFEIKGYGPVRSQSPSPGTPLDSVSHVSLELSVNEIPDSTHIRN